MGVKEKGSLVEFCDRLGDVCRGELRIQVSEPTLRGISVKVRQADGDGGSGGRGCGLLLVGGCVMPWRCHVCYRLRVKSVTSVGEAYTTQPNRKAGSRVLYVYLVCMAG